MNTKFYFGLLVVFLLVLAGCGKLAGDFQPVFGAQDVATRAHRLAEIDDVHRRCGDVLVEFENGVTIPVVEDGA